MFGPQKGATPDMVAALDANLHGLAEVIRRDLGQDVEQVPGAGAAGGLGAGLMAFLGATLRRGAEIVVDAVGLTGRCAGAGVIGLTFVAPPLAEFALRFGPPEYFALTLVGLLLAVFLLAKASS